MAKRISMTAMTVALAAACTEAMATDRGAFFVSGNHRGNGAWVGVGYDITPQFSLGVGFDDCHGRVLVNGTRLSGSVGVYAGFAEYRF